MSRKPSRPGAFDAELTEPERRLVEGLASPGKIQEFLDAVPYSTDPFYRCPLRVLREKVAHCFDGALFAAAALRRIGHPPRIVDMYPDGRDDEHLLAVFRVEGLWGAVAKSNFVGLRYREPVYRSLRELVMSYFEQYFNLQREKTLRAYTRPLDLRAFDRWSWMTSDRELEGIARRTEQIRRRRLISRRAAARLLPVDERSYAAGLSGADPQGLFRSGPPGAGS